MRKRNDEQMIELGKTAIGIELGSTRIKVILIGENHRPIAKGEHNWENRLEDGVWTYHLDDVWAGLQAAYKKLFLSIKDKYGISLTRVGSMGISAMMHGYLPFDSEGNQLTSFRTWRNTTTEQAAERLTSLFQFNIPQRWSIAHLYQSTLNKEEHVGKIDYLTTLAGYVHWMLTGEKVVGVGEAGGMFPINADTGNYHTEMMQKFNKLISCHDYTWSLKDVLPEVLQAGDRAGELTEEGAKLLDPTGILQAGIPLCPPEGDAGTGMVATNSVVNHTGNISAGTSIFSMVVLEKNLSDYYTEIDIVNTPTGKPVAMVHCNNFTSDINAWASLFIEYSEAMGVTVDEGKVFTTLFQQAMKADQDVGGLVSCNYYSGEPITKFSEGRPLLVRMPDSKLTLPNFMRSKIYSALATLKIGMDILTSKEKVQVDYIRGHGGFFKTEKVGQQLMADAIHVPISVSDTASEGGPWGMALLAAYSVNKEEGQLLEEYLEQNVFSFETTTTVNPTENGMNSFSGYLERYKALLGVERAAIEAFK